MSHTPDLEAGIFSDGASYHSTASGPKPISPSTLQSIRVHFGLEDPSPSTPSPAAQPTVQAPNYSIALPSPPSLVSPLSRKRSVADSPRRQVNGPTRSMTSPARSIKRPTETDELISEWDAVRERLESIGISPVPSRHEQQTQTDGQISSEEKHRQEEEDAREEFEAWRLKYVPLQQLNRDWLKNMFLEDILWRGVQLQKECLIMGSLNAKFACVQDHVRREDIHEELCRFSQSLLNYDSFIRSPLCEKIKADILPGDLSHKRSYIRDLAVLEVSRFLDHPEEKPFVEHMENLLLNLPNSPRVRTHLDDMILPGVKQPLTLGIKDLFKHPKKWIIDIWKSLPVYKLSLKEWMSRVFVFCFTMVILLGPLAVMMFFPGPWYIFVNICISTFFTGLVLTVFMDGVTKVDIMATVAAYAAVLIVGMGEAMTKRAEDIDLED